MGKPANPHKHSAIEIVLRLAPKNFHARLRSQLIDAGVVCAVVERNTPVIFDWIVGLLDLQGISDRAAIAYQQKHPPATFATIEAPFRITPRCDRLRAWWAFECGFRRDANRCERSFNRQGCFIPKLDMRKGALAEAAVHLYMFIRDICVGDFVGWIDDRLASHDPGPDSPDRAERMREALLEPLIAIRGTGRKIWSMIMADLLLAADSRRERWVTTGASMIAIDTLVHAFLDRTGSLRRAGAQHPYGPACYGPRGCVAVLAGVAAAIDARDYDPKLPCHCPRFIQHAIWYFAAASGWDLCNGNRIDDRERCQQRFCPMFDSCERIPRHPVKATG